MKKQLLLFFIIIFVVVMAFHMIIFREAFSTKVLVMAIISGALSTGLFYVFIYWSTKKK